jgi:membrane protease YdiL (CAAX protease family)
MLARENTLGRPVLEALIASAAMILFGTLVRCPLFPVWISAVGLLAAAMAIASSLHSAPDLTEVFGLYSASWRMAVCLVIGSAGGTALGMFSRLSHDTGALPSGIGQFVFLAASIGASEELLFRGYIQGRLRRLGPVPAAVLSAAAHSAYKLSLFVFLPEGVAVDYLSLGSCTFVVGLAGGALREWSGSVIPPLAGHVLFDIVVYGERSMGPWWVWS